MLSNILGKWLNRANNNHDEQTRINNLPKHEQARLIVEKLASRKGRPFNPIKAASVNLQCINIDILSFIERVDEYSEKLELSEGLTPKDCFSEIKTITLDEFFTDKEGMYIPLDTLNVFIASNRRLFSAIERGLTRHSRDVEYSIRLMGKCFSSIQNVCKAVEDTAQ